MNTNVVAVIGVLVLYQLSYWPAFAVQTGLEPATTRLQIDNQLPGARELIQDDVNMWAGIGCLNQLGYTSCEVGGFEPSITD